MYIYIYIYTYTYINNNMYTYRIHICICYLLLPRVSIDMSGILSRKAPVLTREFTKGGLVKGGLGIYVLLLYDYC